MNRMIGMTASLCNVAAVSAFALSMVVGSDYGSYFTSMFIAFSFIPMICAFASVAGHETRSAGNAAMVFAGVYAAFIFAVYYAQMTTVHFGGLSAQAALLLDYGRFGLFFNYDLLGYGLMALSTFFTALTLRPRGAAEKWLRALLMIHGVFFISCFAMPLFHVFYPGMPGAVWVGKAVLLFWCAYFIPVGLLSFFHFKRAT